MILPQIPYKMAKNKSQMIAMRSINYTDMLQDGDIVDSKNISARAYPYITTRKARERGDDYKNVEAITVFNGKIAHIAGGKFYYDGKEIGAISNGTKRMEKINTKLVIFPDKVYFDAQDGKLHDLGASVSSDSVGFGKDSITVKNKAFLAAQGYGWSISGNVLTTPEDSKVWGGRVQELYSTYAVQRGIKLTNSSKGARLEFIYCMDLLAGDSPNKAITIGTNHLSDFRLSDIDDQILYARNGSKQYKVTAIRKISYTDISGHPMNKFEFTFDQNIDFTSSREVWYTKRELDPVLAIGRTVTITNVKTNGMIVDRATVVSRDDDGYYYLNSDVTAQSTAQTQISVVLHGWGIDFSGILGAGQNIVLHIGMTINLTVKSLTEKTITFEQSLPGGTGNSLAKIYTLENNGEIYDFGANFKVGDVVFVSGSSSAENNTSFIISQIEQNTIFAEAEIFTEISDSSFITIERRIPNFDFVCESNNRLWGCSNSDNTIYASALGDPTNFFDYSGESTDSYAVAVGSEGEFTACCRHGDSVLFWKETKLHKMIGSYPAEYTLYSYDIEGVEAGSDRSLVVMNEVLYFKGVDGVYAFSGGTPQLISANFGDKRFNQARAGVDGNSYYISMRGEDGKDYLFVYETLTGIWVLEDNVSVRCFLRKTGDGLYMLTWNGEVYHCDAGETEKDMEWHLQFAPLYETIEGHKSYSRLVFRLELAQEGYVIVEVKTDGGVWREAGKVVGRREGLFPISLPINRCDKFEIRLRGKGKCKIHSIKREFYVGGDK